MKWSESESEWVFGPLFFFNFRYIKVGVWGNNNIGIKKCTTIFLWVLNFGQVGGRRIFFQNHTAGMIFSKMVSNLSVLEGIFETKFQSWFFFRKKSSSNFPKFQPQNRQVRHHFFKNSLHEGVFENSWKFVQLLQNITPIRILLCTFLYLCCYYPRPPL